MTHIINRTVYSQLVAQVAPKVIETETEYEEVLGEVEKLLFKKNRTAEEDTLYDLLVMLVEKYEAEHYPIETPHPSAMIEHLLDARGKQDAELVAVLGSFQRVAELLEGKTVPTHTEAEALGEFFKVNVELFLENQVSI